MSAHDRQATPARLGAYWAWNLSEGGVRCRLLSEPTIGLSEVTPAQEGYAAGTKKRPQQDSNLRTRLRRPPSQSSELVRLTCLDGGDLHAHGHDHSVYIPDQGVRWRVS